MRKFPQAAPGGQANCHGGEGNGREYPTQGKNKTDHSLAKKRCSLAQSVGSTDKSTQGAKPQPDHSDAGEGGDLPTVFDEITKISSRDGANLPISCS